MLSLVFDTLWSAGMSVFVPGHVRVGDSVVGLSFLGVLGVSAVGGGLGGLLVIGVSPLRLQRDHRWVNSAVGAVLCCLGLLTVGPVLSERPSVAVWWTLGGGVVAFALSRAGPGGRIGATVGTLLVHQLTEGVLLAAAYVSGGVVGVLAAAVLTVHTALETALVGVSYVRVDRQLTGGLVIVGMQTMYVIAAVLTFAVGTSHIHATEPLLSSVVGGALVVIGGQELTSSGELG